MLRQQVPVSQREPHRADDRHDDPGEHEDVGEVEGDLAHDERVRDDAAVHRGRDEVSEHAAGEGPAAEREQSRRQPREQRGEDKQPDRESDPLMRPEVGEDGSAAMVALTTRSAAAKPSAVTSTIPARVLTRNASASGLYTSTLECATVRAGRRPT